MIAPAANRANRTLIEAASISSTGTVDLTTNDLDITATSLAAVTALVRSGYNLPGGGNWNGTNSLTGWFNDDFSCDSIINGSDYTLIDNAFNSQGAQLASQISRPTAQLANTTAVPEPTMSFLTITAATLLRRRPRRRLQRIFDKS